MLLRGPRTEGGGQGALTEGGWDEQPLDVQAGLSPHEGQGTEPWQEEGQG